ncbi:UNVERIFIED_CONTAM: hypothetical protein GTU68_066958 [Idotea baltica]|nr:hypothetical protein [Idotea baltica]
MPKTKSSGKSQSRPQAFSVASTRQSSLRTLIPATSSSSSMPSKPVSLETKSATRFTPVTPDTSVARPSKPHPRCVHASPSSSSSGPSRAWSPKTSWAAPSSASSRSMPVASIRTRHRPRKPSNFKQPSINERNLYRNRTP